MANFKVEGKTKSKYSTLGTQSAGNCVDKNARERGESEFGNELTVIIMSDI